MSAAELLRLLGDHVWQSTACLAAAALLVWLLRHASPRTRFAVWTAASLKWLIPFAALRELGALVPWQHPLGMSAPPFVAALVQPLAAGPAAATVAPLGIASGSTIPWAAMTLGAWLLGCAAVVAIWARDWLRMARLVRNAEPAAGWPLRAVRTSAAVEPAVFGIYRPVLVLPAGLADHLTPQQLDAVLEHERCHVRRHDNLWAMLHMLVEAAFWFHPLIWWTGRQLLTTRELACDEAVLMAGGDPVVYAQGLLRVCRGAINTPLTCASGVSGGDLKVRIAAVFKPQLGRKLGTPLRLVLVGVALAAVGMPVAIGLGRGAARQSRHAPAAAFAVVSIKPVPFDQNRGMIDGYTLSGPNLVMEHWEAADLIREAYGLKTYQLERLPAQVRKDLGGYLWTIRAVAPGNRVWTRPEVRPLLRAMLADRFHLVVHTETRDLPAYALTVGPHGPRFKPSVGSGACEQFGGVVIRRVVQSYAFTHCPIGAFVDALTRGLLDRSVVLDHTGLTGTYTFTYKATPNFLLRGPAGANLAAIDPKGAVADLGLKLESIRAPVQVTVVDRMQTPSPD